MSQARFIEIGAVRVPTHQSQGLFLHVFSAFPCGRHWPASCVLAQDMQRTKGTFDDCKQCQTAMSSVMQADLLLTKTVIAGDSWGEIAVPVIQEHPATAIIFIGSLLTLVFGVLNIIVAVAPRRK